VDKLLIIKRLDSIYNLVTRLSFYIILLFSDIMVELKIVKVEELHQTLLMWIQENNVIIGDYEDMKEMVLRMIRAGHCFVMDRDRLRDAMEDIAFMMNAEDDALKDRVLRSLEYEDDSEEEDIDIPLVRSESRNE
jgi:hypothetical protein